MTACILVSRLIQLWFSRIKASNGNSLQPSNRPLLLHGHLCKGVDYKQKGLRYFLTDIHCVLDQINNCCLCVSLQSQDSGSDNHINTVSLKEALERFDTSPTPSASSRSSRKSSHTAVSDHSCKHQLLKIELLS